MSGEQQQLLKLEYENEIRSFIIEGTNDQLEKNFLKNIR